MDERMKSGSRRSAVLVGLLAGGIMGVASAIRNRSGAGTHFSIFPDLLTALVLPAFIYAYCSAKKRMPVSDIRRLGFRSALVGAVTFGLISLALSTLWSPGWPRFAAPVALVSFATAFAFGCLATAIATRST